MVTTPTYKYDAFISYSHKDETWVRETLLSTLERNEIKVIIDYRDFEPGAPSITEMEKAVKESWKTILVLTPSYINSAWSEFESIMIATLDPAGRQRRILPILLQDCNIPLRINYLTFLDFTDLATAKLQWDKLITAFDKKSLGTLPSNKKLTPLKEVSTMFRISSDALKDFRRLLMDSDELATQARLRAFFADPRLSSFRSSLPEASSVAERADLLIDFLVSRKLRSGESLVTVFLDILRAKIDPDDARMAAIEEISALMRFPTGNILAVSSRMGMDDILSSQAENLDRYKKIVQRYRQNLLIIEEQMATFIDSRNVAPDLKIARSEIIKKIQEFESEISSQNSFLSIAGPRINAEEITNKDLLNRLDRLENGINIQFHNLNLGLASIYQKIRPADVELIKKIIEEVRLGRVEQGILQHVVEETGRVMKHVIDHGVKVSDPEIARSLANIHESDNRSLSFEQQFELTLPLIPFLLEYKVNLGAGFDLQAVWEELVARFRRPKHD